MPRVLFVIDSLEVGGAERSLLELCRHLRRFEPVVCHLASAAALAPSFETTGTPTVSLGLKRRYPFLAGARALSRCLRTTQADLLHSSLYTAGVTARLVTRDKRPLAHTWVNEPVIHPHRPGGMRWRRRLAHTLDARTAFRVTHFVANSRAIAETNRHALGVSEERVSVIHRGRDPELFTAPAAETLEALRWELGLAPEDRVVLHVGRLRAQKGQETLLAAFPRILREVPNARLVLVGEGPERSALAHRIGTSGLEDRVILSGQRDDVPALLGLADVFAFPSHHEGHPGALVEAMLAGRPIVASDLPVHRETLEARTIGASRQALGLLVAAGDPAALAEAILRLLQRPGEARSMGDQARTSARLRFDIRDVARRHENLYQRLLQEGRHG